MYKKEKADKANEKVIDLEKANKKIKDSIAFVVSAQKQ